ncbi:hypothetical protein [Kitasatospora viridis]|uniref:Uncharacterized protein n=1 Tax=Kitasatospora viridis TaxID=281105 RepID=A0A561UDX7_9ACTN|nr:hypothetical protein [Kitasatospora viridis]TWF97564.1 hypothetical protein FHX73_111350 [Kitasatospora viridis]
MSERRDGTGKGRRIDLSLAQVVASALAAVVGAVLASELGVYGTIIGAAVVSIGATCGGAVFQHLFRRTGEQLREVTDRSPIRTVNGLRQVPADEEVPPAPWQDEHEMAVDDSWNTSPVRRAGWRWTWKGYAAISALVFALAMVPIVIVELAAGKNMHAITSGQDGGGTSFLPERSGGSTDHRQVPADPPAKPSGTPSGGASRAPSGTPSGIPVVPDPSGSASGTPSAPPSSPASSPSTGTPSATPSGGASGTPTPSAQPTPTPTPAAATPSP